VIQAETSRTGIVIQGQKRVGQSPSSHAAVGDGRICQLPVGTDSQRGDLIAEVKPGTAIGKRPIGIDDESNDVAGVGDFIKIMSGGFGKQQSLPGVLCDDRYPDLGQAAGARVSTGMR
jgi:hypothetical protein